MLLIEHFPENYLYENCAGLLAFWWKNKKKMLDYFYNVVFFYLYSSKGGFPNTNPCYIPLSEINTAELGCRLVVLETSIKNSNFWWLIPIRLAGLAIIVLTVNFWTTKRAVHRWMPLKNMKKKVIVFQNLIRLFFKSR